jgi:hypothetical protein
MKVCNYFFPELPVCAAELNGEILCLHIRNIYFEIHVQFIYAVNKRNPDCPAVLPNNA